MPDLTRLNELAHRKGKCPECGGRGEIVRPWQVVTTPETWTRACPNCTDGKVFVLPEMVRVRCKSPRCHGGYLGSNLYPHKACSGRGTIASTDGMVWVKAAFNFGAVFLWQYGGLSCCAIGTTLRASTTYKDPEPFSALIAAIEQTPPVREAIEKAVEK